MDYIKATYKTFCAQSWKDKGMWCRFSMLYSIRWFNVALHLYVQLHRQLQSWRVTYIKLYLREILPNVFLISYRHNAVTAGTVRCHCGRDDALTAQSSGKKGKRARFLANPVCKRQNVNGCPANKILHIPFRSVFLSAIKSHSKLR